ncbi:MAG: secretion system protein F [Anaerolineales bacterium]|nr:MAG: secretion system protein F [Anaerolineales bacterium]
MGPMVIVLAIVIVLAVVVLFWGIASTVGAGDRAIEDRLEQYTSGVAEPIALGKGEKEKGPSLLAAGVDKAIAGRGFADKIATQLARADVKLTPGEYVLLSITSILGLFLIGYLLFRKSLLMAGGAAVLGFYAPGIYLKIQQRRRLNAFNDQLGDTINLLVNSLRSGYSLLQSMETVARELPPPISEEFARVVREVGLGLSNEQAMNNMLRRIQSDDLDLMITAINVQHEVGGNLAEILEIIGYTIRERVRIKGEIRVLTAQGVISSYVISFLPIGMGLLLYLMNPDYLGAMFTELCGWIMMGGAVTGIIIGFIATQKIVRIEV